MENIFGFEYALEALKNGNGTDSRFNVVRGQNGFVTHACKRGYEIIDTQAVSDVSHRICDLLGAEVPKPYIHKNGEVIGVQVHLGEKDALTGKVSYSAVLNIKNNGTGVGKLILKERRLICSNGMTALVAVGEFSIPHRTNYKEHLKRAQSAVAGYKILVEQAQHRDERLNTMKISKEVLRRDLNNWFYHYELPASARENMSFNDFRATVAGFGDAEIKQSNQARYDALMRAMEEELAHNVTLGLDISKYTVLATVTNYLSRRIEQSGSEAPEAIQFQRANKKIVPLLTI